MDIHYITSHITYKRYNQAIKRKRTNIYIYLFIKTFKWVTKLSNNRQLEFPTKSLALIQYSLFALLDNLSSEDLTVWSKQCCQWIPIPPECLRHKGVHAGEIREFMNSIWESATANATDAQVWNAKANVGLETLRSVTNEISNVRNLRVSGRKCTTSGSAVHSAGIIWCWYRNSKNIRITQSDITKRGVVGGKKLKVESNSKRSYVMNATLSQNVVVIIFHEMPPTNNTERVQ